MQTCYTSERKKKMLQNMIHKKKSQGSSFIQHNMIKNGVGGVHFQSNIQKLMGRIHCIKLYNMRSLFFFHKKTNECGEISNAHNLF